MRNVFPLFNLLSRERTTKPWVVTAVVGRAPLLTPETVVAAETITEVPSDETDVILLIVYLYQARKP